MIDLFNKSAKKFLPVKMQDGKVVHVYVPTIKMLGDLSKVDMNNIDVDAICDLIAKILSNNVQRTKISKDLVAELTMDDMIYLINEIMNFVNEVASQKN